MSLTQGQIHEAFDLFDIDGNHMITFDELQLAMHGLGFGDIPPQQLVAMVKSVSASPNDLQIGYSEFESIVNQSMAQSGSPEEVWRAYKLFDADMKGRITFEDLKRVASQEANPVSDATLHKILDTCSQYPQKGLGFDEWRQIMLNIHHGGDVKKPRSKAKN